MTSKSRQSLSSSKSRQSSVGYRSTHPYSARRSQINKTKLGRRMDSPGPANGGQPLDTSKICGQTITIPPALPDILKQYAKGAMRTHPPDLLKWSGAYFRALANGEVLPVKDKVEDPVRESSDRLTPGILRVIDAQLGAKTGQSVETSEVLKRWRGFGLTEDAFNAILEKAQMLGTNSVQWDYVLAAMASTIGQSLSDSMAIICEVMTEKPEGTEPVINYTVWLALYTFLGTRIKGLGKDKIDQVNACLSPIAGKNSGMIGPKDFTSAPCPLE